MVLVAGVLAPALSLAFLDLLLGLFTGYDSVAVPFPAVALAASFVLFLVATTAAVTIGKIARLATVPLVLSAAAAGLVLFVLLAVLQPEFWTGGLPGSVKVIAVLLTALAVFTLSYLHLRSRRSAASSGHQYLVGLLLLPVGLAIFSGSVWASRLCSSSFCFGLAIAAGTALAVLTPLVLRRRLSSRGLLALLTTLGIVVLNLPWLTMAGQEEGDLGNQPETAAKTERISKILLVTVDTLRARAVEDADDPASGFPAIRDLASDSVVFANALTSAPWTLPAVASILTGFSPSVHQAMASDSALDPRFTTLAEYLASAGYATAGFGFNPFLKPERNLDQGFHEYRFFPRGHQSWEELYFGSRVLRTFLPSRFETWPSSKANDRLTRMTLDWLESNADREFFLWLHYYDPHLPYEPPRSALRDLEPPAELGNSFDRLEDIRDGYFAPTPVQRRWIHELYRAEVRDLDAHIGRILQALKQQGIYDEMLVIFSADHGEEFWEHDGFEHGHSLYQELLKVPLLLKLPEGTDIEPQRVEQVVSLERLVPTVLELCELEADPAVELQPSLLSLANPGSPSPNVGQPVVSTGLLYYDDKISIVFDSFKYIRNLVTGREQLFDLSRDSEEAHSVAEEASGPLMKARRLLKEHLESSRQTRQAIVDEDAVTTIQLDKATEEQLRSLGYID